MNFIITAIDSGVYKHYRVSVESGTATVTPIPELDVYQEPLRFIPTGDSILFYAVGQSDLYKAALDFSEITAYEFSGAKLLMGGIYDGISGKVKIASLTKDSFSILNITWSEISPAVTVKELDTALSLTGIPYAVYFEPYSGTHIIAGSARTVVGTATGFRDIFIPEGSAVKAVGPDAVVYIDDPLNSAFVGRSYLESDTPVVPLWETEVDKYCINEVSEAYDFGLYCCGSSDTELRHYDRITGKLVETISTSISGIFLSMSPTDIRVKDTSLSLSSEEIDIGDMAPVVGNDTSLVEITSEGGDDILRITLPNDIYASVEEGVWEKKELSVVCLEDVAKELSIHPYVKITGNQTKTMTVVSGRTGQSESIPVSWNGVLPSTAEIPVKISEDVAGAFDKNVVITAGNASTRTVQLTGTFV